MGAGRVYSGTGTDRQPNNFGVTAARGDLEYSPRPGAVCVNVCVVGEAERERIQVTVEGGLDEAIGGANSSGPKKECQGPEFPRV